MELVQKLKGSGKTVYLISGGFRQMINVSYRELIIDQQNYKFVTSEVRHMTVDMLIVACCINTWCTD